MVRCVMSELVHPYVVTLGPPGFAWACGCPDDFPLSYHNDRRHADAAVARYNYGYLKRLSWGWSGRYALTPKHPPKSHLLT